MSSEAICSKKHVWFELKSKAETIDPETLGLQSGPYTALTEVDIRAIEQQVRILTAAQALLQVINTTPAGLVLRDIYVQYDLLDSAGVKILNEDWRQPPATDRTTTRTGNYTTALGDIDASPVTIYTTGLNSRFNMKVITLYGLEAVGVGNSRGHKATVTNSILLKRGNVKLIDIIDIQSLDDRSPPMIIFRTPIMYKAADDGNIMFSPDYATPADSSISNLEKPIELVNSTN